MRRSDKLQWKPIPISGRFAAALAVLLLAICPMMALGQAQAPAQGAQRRTAPASPTAKKPVTKAKTEDEMAWVQEALKNPELMNAVSHLSQRLITEIQYPAPRVQSRILPRLSDSTAFYLALPNYGQTLHQAQQIFQEELHDSPPLRDFLQKNKLEAAEPKFEEILQRLYEFSEYLGDEVVLTGNLKNKEPNGVVIAEVRKPGLRAFLEKADHDLNAESKEHLRIFDPQQLEAATDHPGQEPLVLIRQDFIVVGLSAATLRDFNLQLDKGPASLTASTLGRRLMQSYQSGTSTVAAADLQKLIELIPQSPPQSRMTLEKTGFADVKYALLENKLTGKNSTNQMELVFNGPRHGVASWIAAPARLGALDFMSPKSAIAEAVKLKSFTQIFDDIVELAGPSSFAMLPQMEAQFNVNLKQDILSKLSGEFAFEMQVPPLPPQQGGLGAAAVQPNFKLIFGVSDPAGLQQSLKRLLAVAPMQSGEHVEDGVTFYSLSSPTGPGPEVNYFFLDGYLVIASNPSLAQEALQLHRSGGSLAHSSRIAEQGQPVKASMVVYQSSNPFLEAAMKQAQPEMAGMLAKLLGEGESSSNVFYAYADETSLRGTTRNNLATDASFGLMAAAIAIPNLLKSRTTANEAAAIASVRTVNTAEVTYSVTYPNKGFAPTLAALGPGASGNCSESDTTAAHACLLDSALGNATCTAGKWCVKSGYRYSIRSACTQISCRNYVVTATPVNESTGGKSFCSTNDAVIRTHGGAVTAPLTAAECKAWEPVK